MSISQNFPSIDPTLTLNFQGARRLDPRISFTRASTATYVGKDGLVKTALADEARFDHNPVTGESLGLLIEGGRTNVWLNSEAPASWTNFLASSVNNYTISPSGTQTAGRVQFAGITNNWDIVYQGIFTGTYIWSAWLKTEDGSSKTVYVTWGPPDPAKRVALNIDGTWRRYSALVTPNQENVHLGNHNTITPEGWGAFNIHIWGAQLEAGDFATSYIPTSASAVTRASDYASVSGSNFTDSYNPIEGTYIVNYKRDYRGSSIHYPGLLYSHSLLVFGTGDVEGELIKNQNVNAQVSIGIASATDFKKMGIVYNETSYGGCLAGGAVVIGSGGFHPSLDTSISFGVIQGITAHRIKSLTYYPERLTDAQLQTLTK